MSLVLNSERLQRIVDSGNGACYGIEWALSDAGRLEYKAHYNPQWRVEGVQKKGLKGLYTTQSASHSFMPGEGLVGKVFSDQKMLFVQDLQVMSEEAVQDAIFGGDHVEFQRADLAKAFDIHSAVFVPTAKGVLEVGSTDKVVSASGIVPEAVLTAMQNDSEIPQAAPLNFENSSKVPQAVAMASSGYCLKLVASSMKDITIRSGALKVSRRRA